MPGQYAAATIAGVATVTGTERLPTGTVTLLFSDIEGSTRLLSELGGRYGDVLEAHRDVLRGVWRTHRGVEVSTEGDSFFVAFGDRQDAIDAAVAGQRAVRASRQPIRVRMGVHSGRVDQVRKLLTLLEPAHRTRASMRSAGARTCPASAGRAAAASTGRPSQWPADGIQLQRSIHPFSRAAEPIPVAAAAVRTHAPRGARCQPRWDWTPAAN